ncbi:MAG: metalloregulator ArsR/SmtB family transcription factor [Bacillota bacterium]|nr:metalloregulator ArsR/SmtB family transcription factor [Bacillota bacterium]
MDITAEMSLIKEKANLLKALSNPVRLCIVKELLHRDTCNVSNMQNCMQLSQSTVSQHLGRLRDLGIVVGDRRGTEVFYSVASEEAAAVIRALFNISE